MRKMRSVRAQSEGACMIVMPTNSFKFTCGVLFGRYPERLAHLHSVNSPREPILEQKWALDNGVFSAWEKNREWSDVPFYDYLAKYQYHRPEWSVVPDWVGDKKKTLELWDRHADLVDAYGSPLAFACQDGMTPDDIPQTAAVAFIGGTTEWKWRHLRDFTEAFPRVHVGRVNSYRMLWMAHEAGAESCDGTGWFRDPRRTQELERYLRESSEPAQQPKLL